MSTKQAVVVESPTTDNLIETLTPAEHAEWLETGALPEPKTPEDSSPPSPEKAASSAGSQPESAVAPEAPKPQKENKRKGAPERIQELLAENRALKAQLAEKPKDAKAAAESSPAATEKPTTERNPKTGQPWKNWDEYQEARDAWVVEDARRKALEAVDKQGKDQVKAKIDANAETVRKLQEQEWGGKVTAARSKYKDFDAVAFADELKDANGPARKDGPIDQFVFESPAGLDVLYYLGSHIEELREIGSLPDAVQWRRLAQIEISLSPSAKPKPRASGPAREVAGTGTAPLDPIKDAVASGDFSRYQRLANAEDLRRRKG